jgi:hypothetical protein
VNFPAAQLKRDAAQRAHAGEGFLDSDGFEQRRALHQKSEYRA